MMNILTSLQSRNEALFYFGSICFVLSVLCLFATKLFPISLSGTSGWYKPFKFLVSIGVFVWTMGWYLHYLHTPSLINWYSWSIIALFGFELIYILFQAARGQLSHFNLSTPTLALLFGLMGGAATIITLLTAYIGIVFCESNFSELPVYYLWSIRLGIFIFVIFSFQGFMMGSRLSHTIGGADGGPGIPVLNWSKTLGDLRVAHFIGMHALQILPLVSYFILKNTLATSIVAFLYALLAIMVLRTALKGKPFLKFPLTSVSNS